MKKQENFGAIITKPGSSIKNKTGSWRTLRPKIISEKCAKCGLCTEYCPDGAIKLLDKVVINYDYCKGCGICSAECPAKAIMMIREEK